MKRNIFFLGIMLLLYFFQDGIYDIQMQTAAGNTISLSSYANKKIIITPINASNPDLAQLHFLDSLQNTDSSIRVIAVPALDFGGTENNAGLVSLSNSLGLHFVIAKTSYVKKNAGINQHILFKWLTDVNENNHFDMDVETIGQLFIVSKNGILYSVINDDVPASVLSQVLSQNVNQ